MTNQNENKNSSKTINLLIYLGVLFFTLPMAWFFILDGANSASLALSILYCGASLLAGAYFWFFKGLKKQGGILCSFSIIMIPLIVFSFQTVMGWWAGAEPGDYRNFYFWIKRGWLLMELSTLFFASTLFYFVRFPLITSLIYFVLWFTAIDAIPFFFPKQTDLIENIKTSSVGIGAALSMLGFYLHQVGKRVFAPWAYLPGLCFFWLGLNLLHFQSELGHFLYFLVNIVFLVSASVLNRKLLFILGSLGIARYIGHLAFAFSHSLVFYFLFAALGFLIVLVSAVLWPKIKKPFS